MKTTWQALITATAVIASIASMAWAGEDQGHRIVSPKDVKWGPGPASLAPGSEAAVLYGDPTKEGLFAMRLKLPAGFHIAPHTHPKPEVVTVVSGTFRLGMDGTADRAKGRALPAGSFFALEPGMVHFAYADEDTVIQLNSNGPWSITYVNPKDDPRQKGR